MDDGGWVLVVVGLVIGVLYLAGVGGHRLYQEHEHPLPTREQIESVRTGSAEIVAGAEREQLKRIRAGAQVVNSAVFQSMTRDAETGRNCGRYSRFEAGWRTWRLDSATGESCIMLASDADWRDPCVSLNACDAVRDPALVEVCAKRQRVRK